MRKKLKVLLTGGTGYIGSHAYLELLSAGHEVVIVDNFSNSKASVLERLAQISGVTTDFVEADVRDTHAMEDIFSATAFDAVMHFAGIKAVGESVAEPLRYYENNVCGSLTLLQTMARFAVKTLVFSSSATVYGDPKSVPIKEDFPLNATNPYGRSKLMVEEMLRDIAAADPEWKIALLRYFNPVGAHASGLIGEDPNGIPNNLMPYIAKVAAGELQQVSVFGNDYPTPDGTGVRDYIHVLDLVHGHLKALEKLGSVRGIHTYNLGTGNGHSVLDMIQAFERVSGQKVPHRMVDRRPGDIAACYADPTLAESELGWAAERGIDAMCRDAWQWQTRSRQA